jgi:hypothetical protein
MGRILDYGIKSPIDTVDLVSCFESTPYAVRHCAESRRDGERRLKDHPFRRIGEATGIVGDSDARRVKWRTRLRVSHH